MVGRGTMDDERSRLKTERVDESPSITESRERESQTVDHSEVSINHLLTY